MQEKKKKARHTISYNVSSRQVCSLGSISGAVMQGALATAFIEPPLAQTEVRGENRGGVGVFQPICLASNAFISVQQTSTGCLILKCSPSQTPALRYGINPCKRLKKAKWNQITLSYFYNTLLATQLISSD